MTHPSIIAGAIDIGNTRIKILADGHLFTADFYGQWQDAMHKYLWSFSGKNVLFGVSSVNPERQEELERELKKRSNVRWRMLAGILPQQTLVDVSSIQGIGSDRVLGLIGALHHTADRITPIITIDCGTAVTVNAMNTRRKCLGGAILPGMTTQLRALHHFTQLLPEVEPAYEEAPCGTSTAQAMRVGVVHGVAGAVKEIVSDIMLREFQNELPNIFLTGGDGGLLLRALESWHIQPVHEPNLVLHGVSALMAQWMQEYVMTTGTQRLNE